MKLNSLTFKSSIILICISINLFISRNRLYGSDISLEAAIVPESATVGIPLAYTLSIYGIDPDNLKIVLPDKKIVYPEKKKDEKASKDSEKSPDEFVPLYIINNASKDNSKENGISRITITTSITYYRPGVYTLPEIKIIGNDGIPIGYKIPEVKIEEVNKEGNFEEIEPPISLSGNYKRIIWIIIILLSAAMTIIGLYIYFKKRKKDITEETPTPRPIEIFLEEVESLKLRESIEKGNINKYVFDISIIFRRYLSKELRFDAAEMTTDEIASKIKKYMPHNLYAIYGDEIIKNMRLWDFSKFAEFTPSAELLVQNLNDTINTAKKISDRAW
ncbi:MAG: hypothetical protein FWF73_04865 [Spirochaetes bacterium]|nr:hypothetical protein [Spirochaetota bacterium]